MSPWRITCVFVVLAATVAAAHASGDARRGAGVFATECSECHSVREGKDGKGPTLFAVLGREAGSRPSYAYSEAMRRQGQTWTTDRLEAYISNPRKAVPGGKMDYDGLPDAAQRADLLAYLATLGSH
ncbi:MAG: c-type cytochrome [Aquabacterium sp.]|nr:MAG: c-type cytochrome [Aquabacterium sp.]